MFSIKAQTTLGDLTLYNVSYDKQALQNQNLKNEGAQLQNEANLENAFNSNYKTVHHRLRHMGKCQQLKTIA